MQLVAGVDEVGRGPLAGPVLAVAVILDPKHPIDGLRDSKKLSEKKRIALNSLIRERALSWAYAVASVKEIDKFNILNASLLAMQRAVYRLHIQPQRVLVDGNRCPDITYPCEAIVGGDDSVPEIAAASIVAKVMRDKLMDIYDIHYPQYGFAKHKGYPTAAHLSALRESGIAPIHRLSYAPVKRLVDHVL